MVRVSENKGKRKAH